MVIGRPELDALIRSVKVNAALLDECPGPHDFVPVPGDGHPQYERCSKCGGRVTTRDARWYRLGLGHRQKDAR